MSEPIPTPEPTPAATPAANPGMVPDPAPTPTPVAEPTPVPVAAAEPTPVAAPALDPTAPGGPAGDHWAHDFKDADLRDSQYIKGFDNIEALAQDAITMLPMIGADKVPKPPEDVSKWNDAQWSKHYTALGRPENVEGYEFGERGGGEMENLPMDDESEKILVQGMFDEGLNQRQAHGMHKRFWDFNRQVREQLASAGEQSMANSAKALQEEWGNAFDVNIDASKAALSHALGGKEAARAFSALRMADGTFLGDNTDLIRLMYGARMSEDGTTQDIPVGSGSFTKTPQAAQDAISAFNHEHDDAIMNAGHPKHDWAIREQARLFQDAYPEEKKSGEDFVVGVPIA